MRAEALTATPAVEAVPIGPPRLERVEGEVRLAFRADGPATRLSEAYQRGGVRLRFPRHTRLSPPQAIVLNTAGGLTGGDRLKVSVTAQSRASAVVTTQAAERIYRRSAGDAAAEVATNLVVESKGSLDWLPQETIVFDRSALNRTLNADIAADARLLAVEAIVLGRAAMGETAKNVEISDTWRIRRNGKLIFADGLRLDGDATEIMAGSATGAGATAFATLILVSPEAESMCEAACLVLSGNGDNAGASARDGMLVARLVARTGQALRADLVRLIERLRGVAMPRVWSL